MRGSDVSFSLAEITNFKDRKRYFNFNQSFFKDKSTDWLVHIFYERILKRIIDPLSIHEEYPKVYLYRRIVQAKLFIDIHYGEQIDLHNIADEACFSKFHFLRLSKKFTIELPISI